MYYFVFVTFELLLPDHCMVQFVKPNLLGTRKEFLNRFVNPITNGQFEDSTSHDVKRMKRRAHVLHKTLEGCVQRFDYSVLTPYLPSKEEYVISVRITDTQEKLYRHYLENQSSRGQFGKGAQLFADFQQLQRVWTHPRVLKMSDERNELKAEKEVIKTCHYICFSFFIAWSGMFIDINYGLVRMRRTVKGL